MPLHHRSKEHSVSVELIHLAAEKAPVIALGVGGVVLLALLLGEAISFFSFGGLGSRFNGMRLVAILDL